MNTQKKLYLLPHSCQTAGWIITGVSAILLVCCGVFRMPSILDDPVSVAFFLFIGLFLIGLSREKQEDEFTVFLRSRSALTAIAVMFGLKIVTGFTWAFLVNFADRAVVDSRPMGMVFKQLRSLTNYGGAFILYLILYKIRLARYNKEVENEE